MNDDQILWEMSKEDTLKLVKERFDYWVCSRGAYILPQHYIEELESYILTGDAKGLFNFEEYKKALKED